MIHPQNEFIDYVFDFYGQDGIYDMQATKEQIATATNIRLKSLKYVKLPFDGDTIDREIVRDILISEFNLKMPEAPLKMLANGKIIKNPLYKEA
tara:strand:- start:378 stop:659 length:282 start_codon:yes stop_codon:yes gene_type:complete